MRVFQETGQGGANLTLFSGAPLSNSLNSGLRQVEMAHKPFCTLMASAPPASQSLCSPH